MTKTNHAARTSALVTRLRRLVFVMREGDPEAELQPARARVLWHAWQLLADPDVDPVTGANRREVRSARAMAARATRLAAKLVAGWSVASFLAATHDDRLRHETELLRTLQELAPAKQIPRPLPPPELAAHQPRRDPRRIRVPLVLELEIAPDIQPDMVAVTHTLRELFARQGGALLDKALRSSRVIGSMLAAGQPIAVYLPGASLFGGGNEAPPPTDLLYEQAWLAAREKTGPGPLRLEWIPFGTSGYWVATAARNGQTLRYVLRAVSDSAGVCVIKPELIDATALTARAGQGRGKR